MGNKVIEVVNTEIFKKELDTARAVIPFVKELLKTKRHVSKFLGVSEQTISNMVADGRLQKGVHYYIGKKIIFIPEAIIELKLNPISIKKEYKPSKEAEKFI